VLPGLAPFWLPPGGKRHVKGWSSRNGSQLFVSRGIGTSIVPMRLLSRPEVAIIEVQPR
jgi:predicted MPP superfamily phosphohydrolase